MKTPLNWKPEVKRHREKTRIWWLDIVKKNLQNLTVVRLKKYYQGLSEIERNK